MEESVNDKLLSGDKKYEALVIGDPENDTSKEDDVCKVFVEEPLETKVEHQVQEMPSEHLRKSELRKKSDVIEKSSDNITYKEAFDGDVGVDKETEAKEVLKNDEVANDMFKETRYINEIDIKKEVHDNLVLVPGLSPTNLKEVVYKG